MTDYPIFRKNGSPLGPTRVYWLSVKIRFTAAEITWPHLRTLLGMGGTGHSWWRGPVRQPSVEQIEKMAAILGCHTRDLCAPPMLGTKLPPYPWPQFTDEVIEQNSLTRKISGNALQVRRKLMMIPEVALARASGVSGFDGKDRRIHHMIQFWEKRWKLDEMTPSNLRLMAENLWCTPLDLCVAPSMHGETPRSRVFDLGLPDAVPAALAGAEPLVAGEDGLDLGSGAEMREVGDTPGLATESSGEGVSRQAGNGSLAVEAGQKGLGSGEVRTEGGDAGFDGSAEGGIHEKQDMALQSAPQHGKIPGVRGRPRMPRTGREIRVLTKASRLYTKTYLAKCCGVPRSRFVDWCRGVGAPSPEELAIVEKLIAEHGARRDVNKK